MRVILDGILYDTEKSEMLINLKRIISSNNNSLRMYLPYNQVTTYYRTKKNTYFEVETVSDKSKIRKISEKEAQRACESDPDVYMRIWGNVEEA